MTVVPSGVERNRRMTTVTGLVLVPLLLLAGATAALVHRGPTLPHLAAGLILVPPLALKMATAGYRFLRYHLSDPGYLAAGVPAPGLRPIAPPLVLSVVVLMGSGIALWLAPGTGAVRVWLPLHRLSFLVFGACAGIHLVVHLLRAPTLELERRIPGGERRMLYLGLSLALGLVLAAVGLAWRR